MILHHKKSEIHEVKTKNNSLTNFLNRLLNIVIPFKKKSFILKHFKHQIIRPILFVLMRNVSNYFFLLCSDLNLRSSPLYLQLKLVELSNPSCYNSLVDGVIGCNNVGSIIQVQLKHNFIYFIVQCIPSIVVCLKLDGWLLHVGRSYIDYI